MGDADKIKKSLERGKITVKKGTVIRGHNFRVEEPTTTKRYGRIATSVTQKGTKNISKLDDTTTTVTARGSPDEKQIVKTGRDDVVRVTRTRIAAERPPMRSQRASEPAPAKPVREPVDVNRYYYDFGTGKKVQRNEPRNTRKLIISRSGIYSVDTRMDVPQKETPKGTYTQRVVRTVVEGVKQPVVGFAKYSETTSSLLHPIGRSAFVQRVLNDPENAMTQVRKASTHPDWFVQDLIKREKRIMSSPEVRSAAVVGGAALVGFTPVGAFAVRGAAAAGAGYYGADFFATKSPESLGATLLLSSAIVATGGAIKNAPRITRAMFSDKSAAVFRGGRRVSPPSKQTLRAQSQGYQRPQQKGIRLSRDRGEGVAKIRDPNLRRVLSESLGGARVKEVRVKGRPNLYKLTESGQRVLSEVRPRRVEVVLARGGHWVKTLRPRAKKAGSGRSEPITPLSKTFGKVELAGKGDQRLLGVQKHHLSARAQVAKSVRINDQKSVFRYSRYAAKNVRGDVLTDVSVPAQTAPVTPKTSVGGFRQGMREQIISRAQAKRESMIDARLVSERNKLISQLSKAELPKAEVNVKVGVSEVVVPKSNVGFRPLLLAGSAGTVDNLGITNIRDSKMSKIKISDVTKSASEVLPASVVKSDVVVSFDSLVKAKSRSVSVVTDTAEKAFALPPSKPVSPKTPSSPKKSRTPPKITSNFLKPIKPKSKRKSRVSKKNKGYYEQETNGKEQAFAALVKKKGRFVLVGTGLSRGAGFDLLARQLSKGLAATGKLQAVAGKVKVKKGSGDYSQKKEQFRSFKKVRGKKIPLQDTIIQKRRFRLGTKSERRQIQSARKSMRWLG